MENRPNTSPSTTTSMTPINSPGSITASTTRGLIRNKTMMKWDGLNNHRKKSNIRRNRSLLRAMQARHHMWRKHRLSQLTIKSGKNLRRVIGSEEISKRTTTTRKRNMKATKTSKDIRINKQEMQSIMELKITKNMRTIMKAVKKLLRQQSHINQKSKAGRRLRLEKAALNLREDLDMKDPNFQRTMERNSDQWLCHKGRLLY